MPLATLQDVKRKLGLADGNTAENESVRSVLLAADRYVLQRTRRALSAGTATAEVHRDIQIGRRFLLNLRPVSSITSIVGRTPNVDQTTETLDYDLVDANEGQVVLLGTDFQMWPPQEAPARHREFRNYIWQFVQVTYTYSAYTPTHDIADATAYLAAYWWSRHKAGILSAQTAGAGVSESYLSTHLPPGFEEMIGVDAAGGSVSWV